MEKDPRNSPDRIVPTPRTLTRREVIFGIGYGVTAGLATFTVDKLTGRPDARTAKAHVTPPSEAKPSAPNQATNKSVLYQPVEKNAPDLLAIQRRKTASDLALGINILADENKDRLTPRRNQEQINGKLVKQPDVLTFWTNRGSENLETRIGISIDKFADGSTRHLFIYLGNISASGDVHASVRLDLDFVRDEATAIVSGSGTEGIGTKNVVYGTHAYDGKTRPLPTDDDSYAKFDQIRNLVSEVVISGQAIPNNRINFALSQLTK